MAEQKPEKAPNVSIIRTRTLKGMKRRVDTTLGWVERDYPELVAWRTLAVEWLRGETCGIDKKLSAIVAFFERYIVQQGLPLDPEVFLARETTLPNFYRTACPDSSDGIKYNNYIHVFLHFVLLHEFSEADVHGRLLVSKSLHNPVPRMTKKGLPKRDESVHSPMPYGYMNELRQMLAAGPNFRDWQWAQNALGGKANRRGNVFPRLVRSDQGPD